MASEPSSSRISLGIVIALIAYIFFITASSFVWNLNDRMPTIQVIFMQNVISFLCILPLALRKGIQRLHTQVLPLHLIRDLFGVVSYYLYFLAIRYLALVDATTLNYTAPFFVPFIWWIWLKERVSSHVWWSIVIGFAGVAIILNPSKTIFQTGFVFGLFAGITSAVSLCAVRLLNLKKEPMSRTLFYFFGVSTLLSLPFAWVSWVSLSSLEWWDLVAIGISTAVGQILLTIAYRYGTASFLSPLSYSTVIYAGFISHFLFNKPLGLRTLIGTILIVIGGTATYLLQKRPFSLAQIFYRPGGKPPL